MIRRGNRVSRILDIIGAVRIQLRTHIYAKRTTVKRPVYMSEKYCQSLQFLAYPISKEPRIVRIFLVVDHSLQNSYPIETSAHNEYWRRKSNGNMRTLQLQ